MFDKHYIDWNHKRIKKIIDHFGHTAFLGKTVLDLGCGFADIGGAFARLGAHVTAVDARQEHLQIAKKKYPHITTVCVDLDKKWPFSNRHFDFVLNLGLICHLSSYEQILRHSCLIAGHLILESEICDSDDVNRIVHIDEHSSIYDWAVNGVGNKPSAAYVESILQECGMSFKRHDTAALNSGPFKYDWQLSNSGSRKTGYRRFWTAHRDLDKHTTATPTKKQTATIIPATSLKIDSLDQHSIRPEIVYTNKSYSAKKSDFRIAVCISGYLRSFEKTFERLFNNLLKNRNADVFIHTWDFLGAPLRGFDAPLVRIRTADLIHKIKKLYKPVQLVIEPAINFPISSLLISKNLDKRDINGVLSMFYKIKACNQLKRNHEIQHGFQYDCVVRTRSDLMFMSPFYLSKDMDTNKLYIPHGHDYEGINDQMAFGSSEIIDKYCALYDNIPDLLQNGEKINPESLVKAHILQQNLPLQRASMHYYIKRAI